MSSLQRRLEDIPDQPSLRVALPEHFGKASTPKAKRKGLLIITLSVFIVAALGVLAFQKFKNSVKSISVKPVDSLAEKIQEGIRFYENGNSVEALNVLTALVSEHPSNNELLLNLAVVQLSNQNFKTAEENLLKVIKNQPLSANALASLGALYMAKDDLLQAEVFLQNAQQLSPLDAKILLNLAMLRERQGRWVDAAENYKIFLESASELSKLKATIKERLRIVRSLAQNEKNIAKADHVVQ